MGKQRDKSKKQTGDGVPSGAQREGPKRHRLGAKAGSDPAGRSRTPTGRGRPRSGWFRSKGPVFGFVVLFGVLLALFHIVRSTDYVMDTVWPAHLRFVTQTAGTVLGLFEDSVRVSGYSISSPRYSLTIARGCDAFEPCALFASGVLAFPAPWLSKLPGMLIGVLSIMALNITRIVTLFYVGVYWPKIFHIMHVDVWQTLFILFAILFWTFWALWATRVRSPKHETVAPDH